MTHFDRSESPELVVLGRITRAQGLGGAVRIRPFGIEPEVAARLVGRRVFVRGSGTVGAMTLESQRWHRGVWIVHLRECATRDTAESLVGRDLCLAEVDRPALGPHTFYDDDLVGARIVDARTDEPLGEVLAIRPAPAANLLQVRRPDGSEYSIPAVRAFIREVDLESRSIRVDLPEGLTDINAR